MRIALVIPVGLFLACHNPELTLKDLKVTLDALSAEEQQTIRRAQLRVHSSRPGPERAEAIGELGMVLHAHGFIDAAARCGDKAAVAAPGEFRWHYYAARAHIESFNYVAALAALDRALALDAGYEPAWTAKGRVLLLLGHLEEAKGAYTSAGALNPNSAVALSGLASVAREQRQIDEEISLLERALRVQPGANELHYRLAEAWMTQGDAEKARMHRELRGSRSPWGADPILDRLRAMNARWRLKKMRKK